MKKDITPKSAEAFYNLGLTHYHKKEYDKAIEYYENALEIDPKYVVACYDLGYIYKLNKPQRKKKKSY